MKGGKIVNVFVTTKIIVERDGDGFHGYAPALQGLHVEGMTISETLSVLREAVECYMESIAKHNDPVPEGVEIKVEESEQVTMTWPTTKKLGTSLRTLMSKNSSQHSNEMVGLRT